jgi:ADP-ribose pyrophosphatase YjhB (NUDIX family)
VSGPRLAVRAVVVEAGRLLLVNAYPGDRSDLWCLPGGGVEGGASLGDNLSRDVFEETGLRVASERLVAISEIHDPARGFHQVELLYRVRLLSPPRTVLRDPEGVVNRLRWVRPCDLEGLRFKPDNLSALAFGPEGEVVYNPLEIMAI